MATGREIHIEINAGDQAPDCRCGHPKYWHAYPPGVAVPGPDTKLGACEITGPQTADGCDCAAYRARMARARQAAGVPLDDVDRQALTKETRP